MARALALVDVDPPTPSMKRALAKESFVECRTLGHAWERFVPDDKRKPQFGVRMSLRCMRCTMERHDLVKRMDGSMLSRGYDPPEGYSLTAEESLSRDQWRKKYIKQVYGPAKPVPRVKTRRR